MNRNKSLGHGDMTFLIDDQEEAKTLESEFSSNSSDDSFDNLARQLRSAKDMIDDDNPYLHAKNN